MRKSIETMSQKEFFIHLRNQVIDCIQSELDAQTPKFYFEIPGMSLFVGAYKGSLKKLRDKLQTLNFDLFPTYYVLMVVDIIHLIRENHPIFHENFYWVIQKRFRDHVAMTGCIMRDITPLNRFNYLNLVASPIKFLELECYIKEKTSPQEYQVTVAGLNNPEESPFPYQYYLLELIMQYLAHVANDVEMKKIIRVVFNVTCDEEINQTWQQVVTAVYDVKKLIENAQNKSAEIKDFDFSQMKSIGVEAVVKGVAYFFQKIENAEALSENDVNNAKKLKKLRTILESKNPFDQKDQIVIAGIINYLLENNVGDSCVISVPDPLKETFESAKKEFKSKDLRQLDRALLDVSSLQPSFFAQAGDDVSELPPARSSTPPPAPTLTPPAPANLKIA